MAIFCTLMAKKGWKVFSKPALSRLSAVNKGPPASAEIRGAVRFGGLLDPEWGIT